MSNTEVYHGSCHCGDVTYEIRLTLPPDTSNDPTTTSVRLYKCNCSTCQKMGMFHCRPISPSDDFILTSPATIEELGDYRAFSKKIGWYFCKNCGCRVFGMGGKWVQEEIDVGKWRGIEGSEERLQKVWKSKAAEEILAFTGKPMHYLSVNAVTLEGVDLLEWHDKKWIFYVENRERKNGTQMRFAEPFSGGCY